jgi:3-hydroxyacyl-[acyl-carrier-protein] dehydratase
MPEYSSIKAAIPDTCLQAISTSEDGKITGTYTFAADFPAFAGHFPGSPVLPAVVQLTAVRMLAARHLETDLVPVKVERAKFKKMIGPEEPVAITILLDRNDMDVTISFAIVTDKGKAAKGEICCRINNVRDDNQ